MKIRDLLKAESILINAPVETKDQAIEKMIDLHDAAGNLSDKAVYTEGILARESQGRTHLPGVRGGWSGASEPATLAPSDGLSFMYASAV